MKKAFLLVLSALLFSLSFLVILDKAVGLWIKRTNFAKANVPNVKLTFESNEFNFEAKSSSLGLRNEEIKIPKPKDEKRILALGDSFTWGWGVNDDEPWPKILEKIYKENSMQTQVINGGVYGVSLHNEVEVCEDYVDSLEVDSIIVGFYSTDDFSQELSQKKILNSAFVWRNLRKYFPNFYKLRNPIVQFHKNIKPGGTYDSRDLWLESARKIIAANPKIKESLPKDVFEDFRNGLINPSRVENAQNEPEILNTMLDASKLSEALGAVNTQLGLLKKCARGRPVYIVFIPSSDLVSKEYQEDQAKLGYRIDERLLASEFDDQLAKVVAPYGFKFISPLNDFRQDGCAGCYFPLDSHLSALGHKRLSEFIFERIK